MSARERFCTCAISFDPRPVHSPRADDAHFGQTDAVSDHPSEKKDTNPKDAVGIRKLAFSVLPWQVLCRVALAMMEGAAKYGRHNYRASGVRASVYFDAIVARHLTNWWEGNDIDPDSGLHELDKAMAGLMVMRDSILQGNFVDDRPPRGCGVNLTEFNELAGRILDRYKDKNPRHYTLADSVTPSHK